MGLLTGALLGPVKLVTWTADRILQVAEDRFYDEQAVMAALAQLNDEYDRGLIDDEGFEAAEDELMDRLETARTRRS
ncbi:MAG: gas vesicle protein GvpG [Actinobacteria bacterium]|nr:gas vesicle protein GvpG [Actinomycetota bacterium]